jgi:ABC-2 type transport system ATP-binding protein
MPERVNILEVKELTKAYESGHRAVDGLSLTVPNGSIFGFVGLNGAGKTTTIRIMAGLCDKDSGSVRLFGKEIEDHDTSYKRRIGFVLDEPLYFDWMSATEYLRFVGVMCGLPESDVVARTHELLEFFDLSSKENEPIASFSTGMKKKVSLAAAIMHKPELIILDEPLEGIDALAANAIKESLTLMASKGTTVFITSHVLDTVERFCTEVAIIHQGKILVQCKTSDIRTLAKGTLANATYQSLEELFVDLLSEKTRKKQLTWL